MAAAGSALLLMVVSPAINGTIIAKFGTDDQNSAGCRASPTAR